MTRDNELKRYSSAIDDLYNLTTGDRNGQFFFDKPIELDGDFEICGVDLQTDDVALVTPKKSIWGEAYSLHIFRFCVRDFSDYVIMQLSAALNDEVHDRAAWWDTEE